MIRKILVLLSLVTASLTAADLRIGLVGLDTSHVIAFTKALNDPKNKDHVPGAKVVAVFKGGSPDIPESANRIEGFTKQLVETPGVKLYDSIAELAQNVDAIMIESVDGRPHLAQFKETLKAGKPVFIDKPVGGSLRDAIEIFRLAKEHNVPLFSSSSLRFNAKAALTGAKVGELRSAYTFGPASLNDKHPDLYWYGIHAVEMLYTVMGRGCESVVRTSTPNVDVVTGVWSDGRVGTMQGNRNTKGGPGYGVTLYGSTGTVAPELKTGYGLLLQEAVKFFQTKVPPVSPEETIEIMAFMEAADESKRRGGAPVKIADVMKKAGAK
jgi:predicted dehydrogenase